jgi:hypothetical protein
VYDIDQHFVARLQCRDRRLGDPRWAMMASIVTAEGLLGEQVGRLRITPVRVRATCVRRPVPTVVVTIVSVGASHCLLGTVRYRFVLVLPPS